MVLTSFFYPFLLCIESALLRPFLTHLILVTSSLSASQLLTLAPEKIIIIKYEHSMHMYTRLHIIYRKNDSCSSLRRVYMYCTYLYTASNLTSTSVLASARQVPVSQPLSSLWDGVPSPSSWPVSLEASLVFLPSQSDTAPPLSSVMTSVWLGGDQ